MVSCGLCCAEIEINYSALLWLQLQKSSVRCIHNMYKASRLQYLYAKPLFFPLSGQNSLEAGCCDPHGHHCDSCSPARHSTPSRNTSSGMSTYLLISSCSAVCPALQNVFHHVEPFHVGIPAHLALSRHIIQSNTTDIPITAAPTSRPTLPVQAVLGESNKLNWWT